MKFLPTLILLLACVSLANADETDHLYSGDVVVQDQGLSAREAAFPRALEQVLGKLSGLRDFEDHPFVGSAVEDARSLVLAFHYREMAVEGDESEESLQTHLVARFSRAGVEELMRTLELPRWPPVRAPLTIWLIVDDGLSRRVMPLEFEYLRSPVAQIAESRGMPLEWPSPAEDGSYGVDLQLLWGGYTEAVSSSGEKSDVLVIAARREGPQWTTRMSLEYEDQYSSWRNRNLDLRLALEEGLHHAIDQVAAAHSIAASDQGQWMHEMVISGLNSVSDYSRCMSYLESLNIVDAVVIQSAEPGEVRLVLQLNAAPSYLEEAVNGGSVLDYDEDAHQYVLSR